MTESAPETKEQLVIDLNFVPGWARKPPEHQSFGREEDSSRERRNDREPRRRDQFDRSGLQNSRPGGGARRQNLRDRPQGQTAGPSYRPEPVDERLALLEVTFLPERRGLAPLAIRLAKSFRAYSLFEVAALFLSKPDYFIVKVEVPASLPELTFFQCAECKTLFLERDAAVSHVFAKHFEKYCAKEEKEGEPPKGNFVCVAKCGLSGVLLGPPNYHGYADKVAEIHRTRYPDMPLEAYRKRIETLHDAAAIEQWKEAARKVVVYRFGEGETAVSFTRYSEAEAYFREHGLEEKIKTSRSVMMPGAAAYAMEPGPLRSVVEEAWQRESRFPLRLSVVLRLAFRHLGLHTFKAAGGHTFVTSVAPNAIDPAHAIAVVREVLAFVSAKPGCTPVEMLAGLTAPVPVAAPPVAGEGESEGGSEAAPVPAVPATESELKRQLQWLVEKGHVIEFSDGRLAVPTATVARVQMARPKGRNRKGQKER
jgi:hypothetical protein